MNWQNEFIPAFSLILIKVNGGGGDLPLKHFFSPGLQFLHTCSLSALLKTC